MTETRNVTDSWNDLGDNENVPVGGPLEELGVTGLKRVGGYVEEEFLPALRGRKAVKVFREMSLNDSMVGSLLYTVDKLIRQVEWKVEPCDQDPESLEAAQFVEECMHDMSHSWDDFISEALSMIVHGWSWHEIVYKKRVGPWETDGKRKSKYTDGKIGWRKMPIRAQETMFRWIFDESGGIKGMVQMAPPTYTQTSLSIEKCLLFRTDQSKGNPEGKSLLRSAYRSWYFKKRLEEFEAIGVERDLAGMPVGKLPSEYFTALPGTPQHKMLQAFKKMVQGVRRDENEGLVIPVAYDQDTKQELFGFELMSSSGTRTFDTNALIQRYEQRILMSVLADFILVGHEANGSYALHTDKTGIFRASLNSIVDTLADTMNRHAIPKLFKINGWQTDKLPKFKPGEVDPPDLTQLAQFITATAGAGMQWFPDPALEKFLRDIAKLPELTPEEEMMKMEMYEQATAMQFAESQMGLMGMQQKAEMTAQGMSPEQAEMQAMSPTPEMAAQMATAEMEGEAARRTHAVGQADMEQEAAMMLREQQAAEMQAQGKTGDIAAQDEAAERQFGRDKAKAADEEKRADKGVKREKEQLTMREKIEDAKHRRTMEQLKAKGAADAAKAKEQKVAGGKIKPRSDRDKKRKTR